MLLVISKLAPLPLYPLGLGLLCSLAALVLLLLHKVRGAQWLLGAGLVVLYFFSLPSTAHMLIRTLESRYPPGEACDSVSAILLLGGAGVPALPPRRYPEISSAGDRLLHTARLYKQGLSRRVIVSGGKIEFFQKYHGSEALNNALLLRSVMGVDSADIILEELARTTREHAPLVVALLDSLALPRRVAVVTSAMHMPRAIAVLQKAGIAVCPRPTDFETETLFHWNVTHLLPSVESLHKATRALHEYYGLFAYRIFGWI
jgi:uncharacterized SAM-binding protein YcdF (DUF218 family)